MKKLLLKGEYYTEYKGHYILVKKTSSRTWLAETVVKKGFRFVSSHSNRYYDHNSTRKAAVEMVKRFIDLEETK